MNKIKVGLIGFGRMGEKYLREMMASGDWDVAYICDPSPLAKQRIDEAFPGMNFICDEDIIFGDPSVQVVGLFALADSRKAQIAKAIASGKHIICEKPIADCLENEEEVVRMLENAPVLSTVNLYLRNSWYHHEMKSFVDSGEIGELAIIRICHMTPGLAPGEGHQFEGPPFHDCGMHYVDIARWYAGSEYATWHSQAVRMWDWKDPWWLQCHGTFANGVTFDLTQGFVYGQLSKNQTHNSYVDLIGTKGIVRMTHDFKIAVVDERGVSVTNRIARPFGGKNLGVLLEKFASSVRAGVIDPTLPQAEDAFKASKAAWTMLQDAWAHDMPSKGDNDTLIRIRDRRANMTDGYGLLKKR